MALTIEDGTVVAGAESYVDADGADAYHAKRGNAAWIGEAAVKEAALLKAATYLDGEYRQRWKGYRVQPLVQSMEWPRSSVQISEGDSYFASYDHDGYLGPICLPSNVIPQRLKDAQCELALRALSAELAPDSTGRVKREKVDVLETEWFDGEDSTSTTYRVVEQLLSDLLKPKGSADAMRG